MHLEVFVHGDHGGPATASVHAWWLDGKGRMQHAYLCERDVLEGVTDTQNPWELLSGLYRHLTALKGVRTIRPEVLPAEEAGPAA